MKKKIILYIFVFLLGACAAFYYYFVNESAGYYNSITNRIHCTNRESCIHEIGHKIDDENGWISETFEWKYAVDWYRVKVYYYPEERDKFSNDIMFFPGTGWSEQKVSNPIIKSYWTGGWGGLTELYAEILAWSDGKPENMPESFREFYDWERIFELMKEFDLE
jgi:hypothetical protein